MEREWVSDCGTVRLICGDCLEVLPTLEAGSVDAVVTDPPYGIGAAKMSLGSSAASRLEKLEWDSETPDLSSIIALNLPSIIWGGNYFPLPPSRCFLVWDKGPSFRDRSFAEVEQAWCSFDAVARIFTRNPLACGDYDGKQHPTQKPTALMIWCLSKLPGQSVVILDPFMGSGTTGVACVRTGRKFIGIEKEPHYFEIAKRRISDELNRFPLLEPKQAPQQLELSGGDQ